MRMTGSGILSVVVVAILVREMEFVREAELEGVVAVGV
jgi:hypothetical protein